MKNTTLLVVWMLVGFISISFGETFNNPSSIAFSRFAQLADTCVASGKLSGRESMSKIEEEVSRQFKGEYLEICGDLLDDIGEVLEISEMTNESDFSILAFSVITEAPQSPRLAKTGPPTEGRYVLYFDQKKKSFGGLFFPISRFDALLRQQGGDVGKSKVFLFPILRKQRDDADISNNGEKSIAPSSSDSDHGHIHGKSRLDKKYSEISKGESSLSIISSPTHWILGFGILLAVVVVFILLRRRFSR